jgi:hypothetical protein
MARYRIRQIVLDVGRLDVLIDIEVPDESAAVERMTALDASVRWRAPSDTWTGSWPAITRGEIDAVLCWHTDRLHRSPAELEDYIRTCEPREVRRTV